MKPRVLFVGRARYALPLDEAQRRKWDAVGELIDFRVVASAAGRPGDTDARFKLLPGSGRNAVDGPLFYLTLPLRVADQLRQFEPVAVICQSPYEAAAALLARRLVRSRAAVVAEVHGDWRTATRLYGSRGRALSRPLADAVAVRALRNVDGIRTLSSFTSRLVREVGAEPTSTFVTWTDLTPFVAVPPVPPPERPRVLFVGVLQPYKNITGLAATWRRVVPRVPDAVLHVVGRGPQADVVELLRRDLPGTVEWSPSLPAPGVAAAFDASTLLFLPSRREGLGRVVIEALARGRPVVAADAGGIPDLITSGYNGALFDPDDHEGMATELVRLLSDPVEAARLSGNARASAEAQLWAPEDYARKLRELVDRVVSSG